MLNYRDELADKRAAVDAITKRLAKPVGESGGYATKAERFAKQKRLQALRRRVEWLVGSETREHRLAPVSSLPPSPRRRTVARPRVGGPMER